MTGQNGGLNMGQKTVINTPELANLIRMRRLELGLTIETAATKAGVGTKTWCRYEAGEAIRSDKVKGICKSLNWGKLPGNDDESESDFDLATYKKDVAWSTFISENFGEAAAVSFIVGSEILLDYIKNDISELSSMPKESHVGQIDYSMLSEMLPEQFLMEYDYEFLFKLKLTVDLLRERAKNGQNVIAHSVIEELAFFLIVEAAEILMESFLPEMKKCGIKGLDDWRDWIYDMFDDCDIVTWLYSEFYVTENNIYHFKYWFDEQFYIEHETVEGE